MKSTFVPKFPSPGIGLRQVSLRWHFLQAKISCAMGVWLLICYKKERSIWCINYLTNSTASSNERRVFGRSICGSSPRYPMASATTDASPFSRRWSISSTWLGLNPSIGQLSIPRRDAVSTIIPRGIYACAASQPSSAGHSGLMVIIPSAIFRYPDNSSSFLFCALAVLAMSSSMSSTVFVLRAITIK